LIEIKKSDLNKKNPIFLKISWFLSTLGFGEVSYCWILAPAAHLTTVIHSNCKWKKLTLLKLFLQVKWLVGHSCIKLWWLRLVVSLQDEKSHISAFAVTAGWWIKTRLDLS